MSVYLAVHTSVSPSISDVAEFGARCLALGASPDSPLAVSLERAPSAMTCVVPFPLDPTDATGRLREVRRRLAAIVQADRSLSPSALVPLMEVCDTAAELAPSGSRLRELVIALASLCRAPATAVPAVMVLDLLEEHGFDQSTIAVIMAQENGQ